MPLNECYKISLIMNSCNDLLLSGNKPLPETMLIKFYDTIWSRHSLGDKELIVFLQRATDFTNGIIHVTGKHILKCCLHSLWHYINLVNLNLYL